MLNTFIANLAHAVRNGGTVHIGGGEFSPGELRKVLDDIKALRAILQDARNAQFDGRMGDLHGILTGDICSDLIEGN